MGLTKSNVVTMEETGLPGRPSILASLIFPKAIGFPGFKFICQSSKDPISLIESIIKSASPTDTPPVVIISWLSFAAWAKRVLVSSFESGRFPPSIRLMDGDSRAFSKNSLLDSKI